MSSPLSTTFVAFQLPTWSYNKSDKALRKMTLTKNMTLKHNESNLKSKKVVIRFLPDNVVVQAEVGKRLLDVALQAGQLKEHPLEPFCRDGGCYKCEMETSNKLFEEYPLIRTCKYTVPVVSEEIQLTKVDNDQLWGENML
ncbi:2Fe-2S iron-sulfur cluster binding domain protein [Galdieria sulphuraria]|uniref:2Fe-2S iron-sulfur cluster binding domain protein n=1 Tax=Galdieria sulphuraria TaxID=130081 RepID=M2VVV3_GALSU|nr:2Fe-2S iron-sulfur cluster binding domain protein [Galdieria sulphuraria]EME27341.1 2Fe-2S iron-sulfur cluster binding domain protein [Galdieria sulphuraria]|eukprot:XP_005703861.1 2Fe-2S iron-sulfur cluster binding domain protein [Galdieria sulphuraria]